MDSVEFEMMINKLGQGEVIGYRNNKIWLNYHPKEALIFGSAEMVWAELESTYTRDFRGLVYGEFPSPVEILHRYSF